MQKKVFAKAAAVEIACFENPEFYDRYVKAGQQRLPARAAQVLQSLGEIVGCVFTVSAMSFVIFTIDPLLILFALLPFAVSLLFGGKMNRLQYDYNMEMQEKSRKRDYVRRVFYLADYAKEIRLSQINKALMVKFTDAIRELRGVIRKYGWKVGLLDYLFTATNDIVVYLGAILYAAYKTLVSKTMLYGDCVVVINTINSVACRCAALWISASSFTVTPCILKTSGFFWNMSRPSGIIPRGRPFLTRACCGWSTSPSAMRGRRCPP